MDLSVRLISEIGIFSRHWRSLMETQMRSLGVTHARWVALWWIAESNKPLNQKQLARKVGVVGPTLVRQLDILEEEGLIERVVDTDRRSRILRLRPAAYPIVEQIKKRADELGRSVVQDIDKADLERAFAVLHLMRTRLRETSGEDFEPTIARASEDGPGGSRAVIF